MLGTVHIEAPIKKFSYFMLLLIVTSQSQHYHYQFTIEQDTETSIILSKVTEAGNNRAKIQIQVCLTPLVLN